MHGAMNCRRSAFTDRALAFVADACAAADITSAARSRLLVRGTEYRDARASVSGQAGDRRPFSFADRLHVGPVCCRKSVEPGLLAARLGKDMAVFGHLPCGNLADIDPHRSL